jgi:hypothetical protein
VPDSISMVHQSSSNVYDPLFFESGPDQFPNVPKCENVKCFLPLTSFLNV